MVPRSVIKATTSGTRNAQTKEALRSYKCEGLGNYAREFPLRGKLLPPIREKE